MKASLLVVELFREIGGRIEGRERRVGLRKGIADQVAPTTQIPSHLVEMAANLLEHRLQAIEQSGSVLGGGGEVIQAESSEGRRRRHPSPARAPHW